MHLLAPQRSHLSILFHCQCLPQLIFVGLFPRANTAEPVRQATLNRTCTPSASAHAGRRFAATPGPSSSTDSAALNFNILEPYCAANSTVQRQCGQETCAFCRRTVYVVFYPLAEYGTVFRRSHVQSRYR